jgi:hypothetical protein
MSKKTTFKLSNWGKQNTPPIIEKIGNACLIASGVGAGVVALAMASPIALPAVIGVTVVKIGLWSAFIGTAGKIITKVFGHDDTDVYKGELK